MPLRKPKEVRLPLVPSEEMNPRADHGTSEMTSPKQPQKSNFLLSVVQLGQLSYGLAWVVACGTVAPGDTDVAEAVPAAAPAPPRRPPPRPPRGGGWAR